MRIYARLALSEIDITPAAALPAGKSLLSCEAFVNAGRRVYPELSDDRLTTLYHLGQDTWQSRNGRNNIFHAVLALSEALLSFQGSAPKVMHRQLLRWNELTSFLDSELFVCSLLAAYKLHMPAAHVPDFRWPHVLNSDHPELNGLYRKAGLVEGHSHLKASSDVFEISWLCLMNHARKRRREFEEVERAHGGQAAHLYRLYLEAARCRLRLYNACVVGNLEDAQQMFLPSGLPAELDTGCDLDTELQRLRCWNGCGSVYDYASPYPCILSEAESDPTDVFAGERNLLYRSLRRIFVDGNADITRWLYRYILCKNKIRRAMIQINSNLGFANFARFERIKEIFIDAPRYKAYSDLLKSQPIRTANIHHYVQRMETRITPKFPVRRLADDLRNTRRLIEEGLNEGCEYSLICHFIKEKESGTLHTIGNRTECERNHKLRMKVKRQAIAIRHVSPSDACISGIDAAASELACRPEVFAQAFRYLRNLGLRFTFHAGEDYYDLVDGLRTIDEAISFTGMHSGDRIGHGTALGIDPVAFYKNSHNSIAMPKHVLLDNIAWMISRALELGVPCEANMHHNLTTRFKELYRNIYRDSAPDIYLYFQAMCLRGDDPAWYERTEPRVHSLIEMTDSWARYALNDSAERNLLAHRENKMVYDLYYRYHYDAEARKTGDEITEFKADDKYAVFVSQLQLAMTRLLAKERIAVEMCPTSNLRISRLGRYDLHPVIAFTEPDAELRPAVTINTDDLGIFCTSLDHEFNLMAAAMYKQPTPDGQPQYSSEEILERMSRLIQNGWNYAFPTTNTGERGFRNLFQFGN